MITLTFTSACFNSNSCAMRSVSSLTLFNVVQRESLAPGAATMMFGAVSRQCNRIVLTDLFNDRRDSLPVPPFIELAG